MPETIEEKVKQSLVEYYKGFELSDPNRMASGITDDFTGVFHIPSKQKGLAWFDKENISAGYAAAFSLYKGKGPVMSVRDVNVVPRSSTEAMVSYRLDFYLEGVLRNVALVVADMRIDDGRWKICRMFEDKEK